MPSKSERIMYQELYTRASTAEQVLGELGYKVYNGAPHSDEYGVLRQKYDASKGIEWKGQENYDFVAEALMKYIQERMISEKGLREVLIPEDKDTPINYRDGPKSDISMSPDFLPDFKGPVKDSALILIQGTGSVRAGVWARSVCLNENLEKGTMLPLIDAA